MPQELCLEPPQLGASLYPSSYSKTGINPSPPPWVQPGLEEGNPAPLEEVPKSPSPWVQAEGQCQEMLGAGPASFFEGTESLNSSVSVLNNPAGWQLPQDCGSAMVFL